MSKIELGELAFGPDEVEHYAHAMVDGSLADILNQLLAEKLGRAPSLSGCSGGGELNFIGPYARYEKPTHSARLVCIEEIK